MTETTAPAAAPAADADAGKCECAFFWTGDVNEIEGGDLEVSNEANTGCPGVKTRRTFAPGHDAKLKSFLIQAGYKGLDVNDGRGTSADALTIARRYGFATQVAKGVERLKAKDVAKTDRQAKRTADREAAKAAKPAATPKAKTEKAAKPAATKPAAPAPGVKVAETAEVDPTTQARIKLGRWEYDAIIAADGTAEYTNKKSMPMQAAKGTYTIVKSGK